MIDVAESRRVLLARLAEFDMRLHDIEAELDAPHTPDWEDQATEREGDEVLERLGENAQAEVARIRAALARIRDGSYGICVKCKEPISEARLAVLPATPLCKDCAV